MSGTVSQVVRRHESGMRSGLRWPIRERKQNPSTFARGQAANQAVRILPFPTAEEKAAVEETVAEWRRCANRSLWAAG
jgi:hypothetical protein